MELRLVDAFDREVPTGEIGELIIRSARPWALTREYVNNPQATALVDVAYVLIEGFRPGVMERLGVGPEACLAQNGRLIYGRMTGWGQEGPLSATAGHDINYLALSGMLHPMGRAGQPPSPPLTLVADQNGGSMFPIFGVLSALYEPSVTVCGQVVDAAMIDGVSAMTGSLRGVMATGDWTDARAANLIDGGAPFYGIYETSDGKFLSVGHIEPQFFAELANKAGLESDLLATRDQREDWPAQRASYALLFKTRTRDAWEAVFDGSDACVTPVLTPTEATEHPHAVQRNAFVEVSGIVQAAPAPRFSRTPSKIPTSPVQAGANTEEVLGALTLQVGGKTTTENSETSEATAKMNVMQGTGSQLSASCGPSSKCNVSAETGARMMPAMVSAKLERAERVPQRFFQASWSSIAASIEALADKP